MSHTRVPIEIPRYIVPVRVDCECRRKQVDLEFKYVNLHWTVEPGALVAKDDVICEGEVEKVFFEILSPADGILAEISFSDKQSCSIHTPIGFIES